VFFYFLPECAIIIVDIYKESDMKYYLAIDIGASSGRHIIGWREDGVIRTKEVFRFPNGVKRENGHLVWDIEALYSSVLEGIKEAFKIYPKIESLSVDTWGVDYVLLDGNEEILPVYAYRDGRTGDVIPQLHEIIPFSELYSRVGCQFQPFNSIYQLYDDKLSGRLERATDMLMIPEYLMWRLCGVKAREYTNATTTGMVNGEFDMEIVRRLGYPERLFPRLSQPKTYLGDLLPEIVAEVGGSCRVVLCATHDTASAVEGIPMEDNSPYISSGTWSLLGVKTAKPLTDKASEKANYSNEGGVGYNRYQKNIMGMWLVNELQSELCPDMPFSEIVKLAEESRCERIVDANAPELLAPESMKAEFDKLSGGMEALGDYFCCAYKSLAESYRQAIAELEENTDQKYEKLYVVGGGAKNTFLNRLTEEATGKRVVALPIEATALGNLKIQMEADDELS
jgi:rhamnulokinase